MTENVLHYHGCPSCYETWPCEMECTIEPDLEDPVMFPGIQFGAYCKCNQCDSQNPTKDWWDRYNGFIRSK